MAGQALYLKYRPQTFEEVVGQEPITRTLRNALREDRLRHAYLFAGPRGTGKTTMARLLAKAANCQAELAERPCNACPTCVAINEGRLLDLIEIDAASNRGIDEIRDIREKVGFRPTEGEFKVYVLDEAHMLTEPAFNALLKTLEEPPPHVIFSLVTTEPHKIPATISSRCQRFDFRRIPLQAIIDRLAYIAACEGLTAEPAALELIARHGTGALRDAISLLDQLASYGDEILADQVLMVLGTVAGQAAGDVVECLVSRDVARGLDIINRAIGDGADPRQLSREVVEYLRGMLLIMEGAGTGLLNATAEQAAEMERRAGRIALERLLRAIRSFSEAATELRRGLQTIPQLSVELAFIDSALDGANGNLPPFPRPSEAQSSGTGGSSGPAAPLFQVGAGDAQPRKVAEGLPAGAATDESLGGTGAPRVAAAPAPAALAAGTEVSLPASGTDVSLQAVQQAWDRVLLAVRQRNPAAEGALRTSCEPVEVQGDELVITYPFPFLREKLGGPQRKLEIEEALSEVMGRPCSVRLIFGPDYETGPKPAPAGADEPQAETGSGSEPLGEDALGEIARWAKERGGHTKIIEP